MALSEITPPTSIHLTRCLESFASGCQCGLDWYAKPGAVLALDDDWNVAIHVKTESDGSATWEGTFAFLCRTHDENGGFTSEPKYLHGKGVAHDSEAGLVAAMEWYDATYAEVNEP